MTTLRGFHFALALLVAAVVFLPQLGSGPVQAESGHSVKIAASLLEKMSGDPTQLLPVIVEMEEAKGDDSNQQVAHRALDLLALYGSPVSALPLVDSAVGFSTASGIEQISLEEGVEFIHEDAVVQPRPNVAEPTTVWPAGAYSAYTREVRAHRVWEQKITGRGITVAVLDSGVAPDIDLTRPTNRLVASVNFADVPGELPDPGGHGTHVAGIIAGNGTRSEGEYVGVAPEANIVDVRVLDSNGNGRVSSIVRGIEWVLDHQTEYNIRIINLSFSAPANRSYRADPLAAAVEIAWKRGLVVVTSAGNGGYGNVGTPAIDPYVITVGATDGLGTRTVEDDQLAWFSAWGTPTDSTAKPDVVAPGRKLVSIRVAGSYLDQLYPERVVVARNGSTYFRMTGTSMSTGVVSGIVALLLQHQPYLKPDQVKAILSGTTQPYGQKSAAPLPDPLADGYGLVDADKAFNSSIRDFANRDLRPSDPLARALYAVLYGQPIVWKDPYYSGIDWNSLTWETLVWNNAAWDNAAWDSFDWTNAAWDNAAWDNAAWDNAAWDNAAWDNAAWDSLTLD